MALFNKKPKELHRVVQACGGWVPQVYEDGTWNCIDKNMFVWASVHYVNECIRETEATSQSILDSYKALTT